MLFGWIFLNADAKIDRNLAKVETFYMLSYSKVLKMVAVQAKSISSD